MLIRVTLFLLLGGMWLGAADLNPPALDKIQPLDFQRMIESQANRARDFAIAAAAQSPATCSIPLLEKKAQNPEPARRRALPYWPKMPSDRIAGRNPAPVCRNWNQ